MNAYWASYNSGNPDFWNHEWSKHGTCATTVDPKCYANYTTQQEAHDHSKKVLQLKSQFGFYPILAQQGVVPGRTYARDRLQTAFKNGLGANVYLQCNGKALQEAHANLYITSTSDCSVTDQAPASSCPASSIQYIAK